MIDVESVAALRQGIPGIPESRVLDTIVEEMLRWDRRQGPGCAVAPEESTRWAAYSVGGGSYLITACDPWGISAGIAYAEDHPLVDIGLVLRGAQLADLEVVAYSMRYIRRRMWDGFFQAWGAARATVEALSA